MRADARRNYERLLACAHEAFTERGADASLEDIARRAGVGIGTLYRHFPTRETLLTALLSDQLRGLTAYAEQELVQQEPGEAMANWILAMSRHGRIYRGLAAGVLSQQLGDRTEFDEACAAAQEAGDRVLHRAQAAGAVRPDVARAHLVALVHGLVLATENSPELFDQLLAVMLDGLQRVTSPAS
ncbi:TetR/AcrR family transcriptional regulator [Kutzneria sp. CA-103260]|uniref:TetR/AcrR family transcriptional regulator n=1 Tax=Kutzneria sp. CA-103260 TaxID=2802641 RepID=UPI001BAB1785|nr:TetR/AcrR family transcriptional regulator [Kutzneria sp. CA-103260]QUQ68885.1 TetR/AcrR family transcriptional regulator [Kutzneria sp. CA-103260]